MFIYANQYNIIYIYISYDQLLNENSFQPDTTSKFLIENVLLKTKLLSIDKDVEFKDEIWFESLG
jgi:hypothetical protein